MGFSGEALVGVYVARRFPELGFNPGRINTVLLYFNGGDVWLGEVCAGSVSSFWKAQD